VGMARSRIRFCLSIAVTAFLFYYLILLLLPGYTVLREADTFWQIRVGQWILDNAQVPVSDFYSHTAFGHRWISGQWLSEILFALAFEIGQWRGVVILSAVSYSAGMALLGLYLVRNLRISVAIGWLALTALVIAPHYTARPHIFSYILLLIWIIVLLDSYDSDDFKPSTTMLSLLMILWANIHGSFVIGIALLYVFAGYSCCEKVVQRKYVQCRNTLLTLVAVSGSALLTPYGAYSALLVLQVMNMNFVQANITEWQPPNFQAYSFYLLYLIALLAGILALGIRLRGPRLLAFSMMMFFALGHIRGLMMFFLIAPIIIARPLAAHAVWLRPARYPEGKFAQSAKADPVVKFLENRAFTLPMILFALAAVVTAYRWQEINIGPPKSISPTAAIDFVRRAGITGKVFNSYSFGGFLIFEGIPTFIDGRTPPYTDAFVHRYSDAVNLRDINDAFRLLDDYDVHWAFLVPEEPLGKALAQSALWDEVYSDNVSVVFVRR